MSGILIIDPSRLLREGLQELLLAAGIATCGEGRDLQDALDRSVAPVTPEMMIWGLDLCASELDMDHLSEARDRFPTAKIVVLAGALSISGLRQAMQIGIDAILSRDISSEVLQHSLRLVLLGQRFFPASITGMLLDDAAIPGEAEVTQVVAPARFGSPATPVQLAEERAAVLSEREKQILQCLVSGASNKMIARDLAIAEATIKVHVKALLRKVRAVNRTQAAIWALHNGFGKRTHHHAEADMA